MKDKTKLITTSIAYTNSEPHIGFLLELLSADILNRSLKLQGESTFFLTGTDEHGIKVAKQAAEAGLEPSEYAHKISQKFRDLGPDFKIEFDYFVRTTDKSHQEFVQERWRKLAQAGYLEKRSYQGFYCSGCEAFKTERELVDGKCPIHETVPESIKEENWFFTLSKFQEQLLEWLESEPIMPKTRANEVREFIKSGLEDVSFSRHRSKLNWGVPVPDDAEQVMYVWADALLNYLSGPLSAGKKLEEFWPADFQIIGKDILRFHAVIWPALLLALGYELPNKLIVHGFINSDGKKMSKSMGNVIAPADLVRRYGVDGTRYLLFRQLSYYEDSNFVWNEVDALYNGELANGLGNLVARTVSLLKKFNAADPEVARLIKADWERQIKAYPLAETLDFAAPLKKVNELVNAADGWISTNQPWTWAAKNLVTADKVQEFLTALKLPEIATLLEPYTPETAAQIKTQLKSLEATALFPRI